MKCMTVNRAPKSPVRGSVYGLRTVGLLGALALTLTGCTATSITGTPAPSASAAAPTLAPAAEGCAGLTAVPGIVQQVEPSVVTITSEIGLGSGVVYRSDGIIVTDAHVVEDRQKQPFTAVEVQFADGTQSPASVIAVDDVTDVAVVKTKRDNLPVPTYSEANPVVGQLTVVIGSPLGLDNTVTSGIVSALHRNMPPSQESPQGLVGLIQTDAPISPGNSGGAVVNCQSELIGLSEAYIPPSSGAVAIGFVTPAATVTDVADQLLKSGTVQHAYFGIVPREITPQIAEKLDLASTDGALVIDVVKPGPAATAGLQPGDVITEFDGTKVVTVTDLLVAIRGTDPGEEVRITFSRGTASKTVTATLTDRPSN